MGSAACPAVAADKQIGAFLGRLSSKCTALWRLERVTTPVTVRRDPPLPHWLPEARLLRWTRQQPQNPRCAPKSRSKAEGGQRLLPGARWPFRNPPLSKAPGQAHRPPGGLQMGVSLAPTVTCRREPAKNRLLGIFWTDSPPRLPGPGSRVRASPGGPASCSPAEGAGLHDAP